MTSVQPPTWWEEICVVMEGAHPATLGRSPRWRGIWWGQLRGFEPEAVRRAMRQVWRMEVPSLPAAIALTAPGSPLRGVEPIIDEDPEGRAAEAQRLLAVRLRGNEQ